MDSCFEGRGLGSLCAKHGQGMGAQFLFKGAPPCLGRVDMEAIVIVVGPEEARRIVFASERESGLDLHQKLGINPR